MTWLPLCISPSGEARGRKFTGQVRRKQGHRAYLPFLEIPSVVPSRSDICLYAESLDPVITALRYGISRCQIIFVWEGW